MIIPIVNLTREQVEKRLDDMRSVARKIEVLASMPDNHLDIIVAEANDLQFQITSLLEGLYGKNN
jgi:hypothetical protein